MHEYSLMHDVIDTITARLRKEGVTKPGRVSEVKVRVGALEIHSEASFVQAYKMLARDGILQGSTLNLEVIPGTAKCSKCGNEETIGADVVDGHDPSPMLTCPRCGELVPVMGGRGLGQIDLTIKD